MIRFLVGVDEAGRGPLAGPVAVGLVLLPTRFNIKKHFPGVADTKKLSPKKREEIYALLQNQKREATLRDTCPPVRWVVVFASAQRVDKIGITKVVRECVWRGVHKLIKNSKKNSKGSPCSNIADYKVLLDGLLVAPPQYNQKTIIHGDQSQPIISLASIVAKVERDRLMCRLARKFSSYGFEVHKGYGTKKHYEAIEKHGLCAIHRRTFVVR